MKGFVFRYLIFSFAIFGIWGCELETFEEIGSEEISEQVQSPFQVQSVDKNSLNLLGKKIGKRTGFNVIESAQQRAFSDFTFDLDASLLTTDTLKRRTYTVPFLEMVDRYSTFNLVMVADSTDNVLDQYVLQYEFDSIQYHTFLETENLLSSGVTIKRFPFSSFFNDSNPAFLERCQGISDANGDPVVCDQITINSGSGTGGGGSGSGSGGSITISPGSGGGGSSCGASVSYIRIVNCPAYDHPGNACTSPDSYAWVITISCNVANQRKAPSHSMMECMNCDIDDFGSPAFTPTKTSNAIDRDLGGILTDYHLQYLSNNPTFANNLRAAILADSEIDESAALFTIAAGMNGSFTGNFNSNFGLAIEGLMTESTADFSNDIIIRLFQSYFDLKYAMLKQANPSWTPAKLYYETAKEAIHLALDGIGLIEGFGTPADLLNAGLYYLEGDRLNGNLSLVAATPVIGLFSTTVKGALRLKGIIPGTTRRITQVWAKNGNIILFGGTRLRKAMGLTDPTKHAHHILPLEHVKHPVIQKAAKSTNNPFHINELNNGIEVLASQNTTHPAYNAWFLAKLESFNRINPNATPEQAYNYINQQISKARTAIQNLPANGKINDVKWD
ncbi:hypothetical protein [Algoriphagus chordae]|uniref:Uncharacterized protein n=1 Tax=Algoriphagus chordae TaxID=237019 RepID=A0A2W7QN68_9BACT|nr:hypothetical protein [Algoriphagus chordae]PZX49903.1 hypothetical protein LV85_02966 [Algoriphagus chordae]